QNPALLAQGTSIVFKSANESGTDEPGKIIFDYSTKTDDFELVLTTEYGFEANDTITYYYLKIDKVSVKYKTIKSPDTATQTITGQDIFTGIAGDIEFNPYILGGSGEYRIFALIVDNSTGNTVKTDYFTVEMNAPILSEIQLKINYTEIENSNGGIKSYYLYSEITHNGKKVNSDDFIIIWFMGGQDALPYSNRSAFEWQPTEPGNYTVTAQIEGGTSSNTISIVVDYNRTYEVLAVVIGVALLMTLFVVLATYIKVKSERIW
ncbi:MAG: hypothetical protein PHH71_03315, partial [Clostridia bacterium]|nr:hypothetical protein [Clostridia bacterium]